MSALASAAGVHESRHSPRLLPFDAFGLESRITKFAGPRTVRQRRVSHFHFQELRPGSRTLEAPRGNRYAPARGMRLMMMMMNGRRRRHLCRHGTILGGV